MANLATVAYMFTGIIRHLGKVKSISELPDGTKLIISTSLAKQLKAGDSLAVNGTCLTVLKHTQQTITFHLMQETLQRTNLDQVKPGSLINLEKPVTASQPIDGHFVMGHVDGLAKVTAIKTVKQDKIFTFRPPARLMRYLIPQGSVALDGVSLTVVDVNPDNFTVSMMPYTVTNTVFGAVQKKYQSNIEVDVLGKYVERLLLFRPSS